MLDRYYGELLQEIIKKGDVTEACWREFAGHRFLYVKSPLQASQLAKSLLATGGKITVGTKLKVECSYVRSSDGEHVFRFRLLVPNEKQFCCGNLCEDCFLLRERDANQNDLV